MEDEKDWLIFFGFDLVFYVFLMLAKKFRVQLNVAGLVNTMYVSEASCDGEVGADGRQRLVNLVNVFRLSIQRVVVDGFVIYTVFFTTSDADFLLIESASILTSKEASLPFPAIASLLPLA